MPKRMLIDALHPDEMRMVIADEKQIYDFDFISSAKKQVKGNIYLAKITRVEPSLQAAFVEYGGGKQGFLPFSEIHADYYQIPVSDRKRLIEEAEADVEGDDSDTTETPADETAASPSDAQATEEGGALTFPLMPEISDQTIEEAPAYEAEQAGAFPVLQSNIDSLEAYEPQLAEAPSENADSNSESSTTARERAVGFVTSEIVSQETLEHEELAGRLNGEPANEQRSPASSSEGVETLASEDEEISARPKRNQFHKRYKIQEVIKRGQIVLVQVIKEERGNKGVSLTTYLSLAGRYCVLMPNSPKDGGVSRKISDGDTRKRLKEVMAELKLARGMSVIIRTAGIDRTRAEIRRDFDYLVKLWNRIREVTISSTAPALIYEETDLIKRAIRDQYTSDIEELVVEGDEAFSTARDFMKMLLPSHTPRVKHYKDGMPLFYRYGVEDQLILMHEPVVKLKSGGYLVINPTEALISIDVNSGRSTGERNIEETAAKTNLEAAVEVARQLRLRDLAGLIVIDFIDMMESRNRRNVERAIKDALKSDRAKIQLGRISPFGLMEMSRQRLRPSIAETSSMQCPHCLGRGSIRSNESLSIQIVRALEKEAATGNWQMLKLCAAEGAALHLLNNKRNLLTDIEQRYGVQITISIDHSFTLAHFVIEKTRRAGGQRQENNESRERNRNRGSSRPPRNESVVTTEPEDMDAEVEADAEPILATEGEEGATGDANRDRARRRRGRRGGRNRNRSREFSAETDGTPQEGGEFTPSNDDAEFVEGERSEPVEPREGETGERDRARRRSRGGRGRRRWKDRDGNPAAAPAGGEGEEPSGAESYEPQPINDTPARTPQPRQVTTPQPSSRDAETLPSFTREPVVIVQPQVKPELVVSHLQQDLNTHVSTQPLDTSARPDGAPARKGWWQRMIELD